jgi:LysM repeat protein
MAKLDTISVFVTKENGSHSVEATKYPVEKGEPFTDHVKKNPSEFSMSGYLLTDKWQADFEKLKSIMYAGKIIKYVGKTSATDVIILNVNEGHSEETKNGLELDFTLRKIRVTKNAWEAANPKTKPSVKPNTKSGTKKPIGTRKTTAIYHVVKKNDTYSALSKKYGTSIAQLRAWNKYPDRLIPIGVKLRVK